MAMSADDIQSLRDLARYKRHETDGRGDRDSLDDYAEVADRGLRWTPMSERSSRVGNGHATDGP